MATARPRLLRIARLQGVAADGAEDVAQETLLEAWRALDSLRDGARFDAWLDGICRNLCRRWLRAHAALAARQQPLDGLRVEAVEDAEAHLDVPDPHAFDPDEALDRRELARLLDRALSHLHPSAREPVVLRYIAELPTAAIAARLGITVSAVEVRLHRARRELRAALDEDLRDESEAFGIIVTPARMDGRQETRIWCPLCGMRRLEAQIDGTTGVAHYWCAACGHLAGACGSEITAGVSGYKPILSRVLAMLTEQYSRGLATRQLQCACGRVARVELGPPAELPEQMIQQMGGPLGLHIRCPACGIIDGADLGRLTIDRIESQRFWREHPRVRTLPPREVETAGVPAVVMSVESVTDGARLDLVWARETLEMLAVHGARHT